MGRSTNLQSHQDIQRVLLVTLGGFDQALDQRVTVRSLLGLAALETLRALTPERRSRSAALLPEKFCANGVTRLLQCSM
ncbi:hypothetical protein MF271_22550 (plasmid) [Deinococcus sp. KNUC1210]|uniref:hypothetical protein n=1 Tax=Deinococcus sp. KNUC1210 TaxID=2917691 RepID=UPI001EF14BE6|nr:hypothetical protein [Deinococcus sp. KNUC1210]ULH18249.1 hypothetical protein MF271_22550 [Deinococcus sp. KNUC1210]